MLGKGQCRGERRERGAAAREGRLARLEGRGRALKAESSQRNRKEHARPLRDMSTPQESTGSEESQRLTSGHQKLLKEEGGDQTHTGEEPRLHTGSGRNAPEEDMGCGHNPGGKDRGGEKWMDLVITVSEDGGSRGQRAAQRGGREDPRWVTHLQEDGGLLTSTGPHTAAVPKVLGHSPSPVLCPPTPGLLRLCCPSISLVDDQGGRGREQAPTSQVSLPAAYFQQRADILGSETFRLRWLIPTNSRRSF